MSHLSMPIAVHCVSFTHCTQVFMPVEVSQAFLAAGQAETSAGVQATQVLLTVSQTVAPAVQVVLSMHCTQRFVVVSQALLGRLAQSALARHCTQLVPPLQSGVRPLQAALAPHLQTPPEHALAAVPQTVLQLPQ